LKKDLRDERRAQKGVTLWIFVIYIPKGIKEFTYWIVGL
jgi:hypothetical protein